MADIGNLRVRLTLDNAAFRSRLVESKSDLRDFASASTVAAESSTVLAAGSSLGAKTMATQAAATTASMAAAAGFTQKVTAAATSIIALNSALSASRSTTGNLSKAIESGAGEITSLAASAATANPELQKMAKSLNYISAVSDFSAKKVDSFSTVSKLLTGPRTQAEELAHEFTRSSMSLRLFYDIGWKSFRMLSTFSGGAATLSGLLSSLGAKFAKSPLDFKFASTATLKRFPQLITAIRTGRKAMDGIAQAGPMVARAAVMAGAAWATMGDNIADAGHSIAATIPMTGKAGKTVIAVSNTARNVLSGFGRTLYSAAYQAFRLDDSLQQLGDGLQKRFRKPVKINLDAAALKKMTVDQLRTMARDLEFPIQFRMGKNRIRKDEIVDQFLDIQKQAEAFNPGATIARNVGKGLSAAATPVRAFGNLFNAIGSRVMAAANWIGGAMRKLFFPMVGWFNSAKASIAAWASSLGGRVGTVVKVVVGGFLRVAGGAFAVVGAFGKITFSLLKYIGIAGKATATGLSLVGGFLKNLGPLKKVALGALLVADHFYGIGLAAKGFSLAGSAIGALTPYLSGLGSMALTAAKSFPQLGKAIGALTSTFGSLGSFTSGAIGAIANGAVPLGVLMLGAKLTGKSMSALGSSMQKSQYSAVRFVGQGLGGLGKALTTVSSLSTKLIMTMGKLALAAAPIAAVLAPLGAIIGGALVKKQFDAIGALAKTSDALGVTTEAMAGLRAAGEAVGVSMEDVDRSVNSFVSSLHNASEDNPLTKAVQTLGLSVEQLRGMSPDRALGMIGDAMNGISNDAERARLAVSLFGEDGAKMADAIKGGTSGLAAAAADAQKLGTGIGRIDAGKVELANRAIARLQSLFTGIVQQLAVGLAPYAEAAASALTKIGTAGDGASGIAKVAINGIVTAIGWILDGAEMAVGGVLGMASSFINFGRSCLSSNSLVMKSLVALAGGWDGIRSTVLRVAASFVDGLANMATSWSPLATAMDYGLRAVKVLGVVWYAALGGALRIITAIAEALPDLPEFLGGGRMISTDAINKMKATTHSLIETAKDLNTQVQSKTPLIDPKGLHDVAAGLRAQADAVGNSGKPIQDAANKLNNAMAGIPNSFENPLKDASKRFKDFTAGINKDAEDRAKNLAVNSLKGTVAASAQIQNEQKDAKDKRDMEASAVEQGSVEAARAIASNLRGKDEAKQFQKDTRDYSRKIEQNTRRLSDQFQLVQVRIA